MKANKCRPNTSPMIFLIFLMGTTIAQAIPGNSTINDISIAIPSEVRSEQGLQIEESGGVFIGVRKFKDDAYKELFFAVDDAVDLAHLFTLELLLLNPQNVILNLSGEPKKDQSKHKLEQLLQAGAQQKSAEQFDILKSLEQVGQMTQEDGIFVLTVATHGFTSKKRDLIAAADSLKLRTEVELSLLFDEVSKAKASRRLVLLDACRELISRGSGRTLSPMTESIRSAKGQIVLAGATVGELTYGDPSRQNGVFSSEVIAGLRGAARPQNQSGLITVLDLVEYVDHAMKTWRKAHVPDSSGNTGISFNSEEISVMRMPLAVHQASMRRILDDKRRKDEELLRERQRQLAFERRVQDAEALLLSNVNSSGPITGTVYDRIVSALKCIDLPMDRKSALLKEIEVLQDASNPNNQERLQRSLRYWFDNNQQNLDCNLSPIVDQRPEPDRIPSDSTKPPGTSQDLAEKPPNDSSVPTITPSPSVQPKPPLPPESQVYQVLIQYYPSTESLALEFKQHLEAEDDFHVVHFDRLLEGQQGTQGNSIRYSGHDSYEASQTILAMVQNQLKGQVSLAKRQNGTPHSKMDIHIDLLELPPKPLDKKDLLDIAFLFVPSGEFLMGSPLTEEGRQEDEVPHSVSLTQGFWMSATEVTQGQWRNVIGNNPSSHQSCGDVCPVEQVSWWDAVAFANRLSQQANLETCYELSCDGYPGSDFECQEVKFRGLDCEGFRLPTEAEWEWAARARTTGANWKGKLTMKDYSSAEELEGIAWYRANAEKSIHPVGLKEANPWGLYDVLGNVWEWIQDSAAPENKTKVFTGTYDGIQRDPIGTHGSSRVLRGCSWLNGPTSCRVAYRSWRPPELKEDTIGFRLVKSH